MLKRLLDQWNTFTAGGSTKLSPDQYHRIQDGVHISKENLDALKLSKLVGDITNTRADSGPFEVHYATVNIPGSEDNAVTFFKPEVNEIWKLGWGRWIGDGSSNRLYQTKDVDGSGVVEVFFSSATSGAFCTDGASEIAAGSEIIISQEHYLQATTYNDSDGADWHGFFYRLR